MTHRFCDELYLWLQHTIETNQCTQPSEQLHEHVADCPHCRGALLTLAAGALQLPPPPETVDCGTCEADLSAFIELEELDPNRAAQTYPMVWWHLWTCAECAEVYRLTKVLVTAQQNNELAPLPIPSTSQSVLRKIQHETLEFLRLTRNYLHRALPQPRQFAAVMRGEDTEPTMISSRKSTTNLPVVVSVQEQQNDLWTILVETSLPEQSQLSVVFDNTRYPAIFDAAHNAFVAEVPGALLTQEAGPDLVLELHS